MSIAVMDSRAAAGAGVLLRGSPVERRFEFELDTFAFANELVCAYEYNPAGGWWKMVARQPRPDYVLRCFVLVRAARQFFYHAEFDPAQAPVGESDYRQRIEEVLSRNPRRPAAPDRRVVFPGYNGLKTFSQVWETLLKRECGGAWRSYVLRSHWRMVLPITRQHQERTKTRLLTELAQGIPAIVHLVRFPQLTINHGMLLYAFEQSEDQTRFLAYDPNTPERPIGLKFEHAGRTFTLPANPYWPGGCLDVIAICRSWWF